MDPCIHRDYTQSALNSIEFGPTGPSIGLKSLIQNLNKKIPVTLIIPWEEKVDRGGGISRDLGYLVFHELTRIEDTLDLLEV